jgi:integration host factor subunit alpha
MTNKTLTRADLTETLHRDIGLSRTESADMVNSVLDLIADELVLGNTVKLSSFGTFMLRDKRQRMGHVCDPAHECHVVSPQFRLQEFRHRHG